MTLVNNSHLFIVYQRRSRIPSLLAMDNCYLTIKDGTYGSKYVNFVRFVSYKPSTGTKTQTPVVWMIHWKNKSEKKTLMNSTHTHRVGYKDIQLRFQMNHDSLRAMLGNKYREEINTYHLLCIQVSIPNTYK